VEESVVLAEEVVAQKEYYEEKKIKGQNREK
jgi:hypothetical protein